MRRYSVWGLIFMVIGFLTITLRKLILDAQEPTKKGAYSRKERHSMLIIGGLTAIIMGFLLFIKSF